MTTEQTQCKHMNWDDYHGRCDDCDYELEACDECMHTLTQEEMEHEAEYVAKLCADCKDYNKENAA